MVRVVDETLIDLARGALLGALVGDAAGGPLEFILRTPHDEDVAEALRFPGGGIHRLAPGQITDDGELTICLAHGLRELPISDVPNMEPVAHQYFQWMQSNPFDLGHTTESAMGACQTMHVEQGLCAETMRVAAIDRCMFSKANGSLMRSTPLGIWGHRLPPAVLAKWARTDSQLSHPNVCCADAVAAYVIAIAHLLTNPGDNTGAVLAAKTWTEAYAYEDVGDWLRQALEGETASFTPQDGFVKIAFTHAFHHLAEGTSYTEAIRTTIAGGGDTDTNACIVGGLIGALHGASAIPSKWREAVLQCDTKLGRSRPHWLYARTAPELVDALLKRATA